MLSDKWTAWGLMVLVVALYYAILYLIVFVRYPRAGKIVVRSAPPDVPPSLMGFFPAMKFMDAIPPLEVDVLWLAVKGLLRMQVGVVDKTRKNRGGLRNHYVILHKEDKTPDALEPTCAYQRELLQKLFPGERQTLDTLAEPHFLRDAADWVENHYHAKTRGTWTRHGWLFSMMALVTLAFCEMLAQHVGTSLLFTLPVIIMFAMAMVFILGIGFFLCLGVERFPSFVKYPMRGAIACLAGWAVYRFFVFINDYFTPVSLFLFFSCACTAAILAIIFFSFRFLTLTVYRTREARKLADETEGLARFLSLKEKGTHSPGRTPEEKLIEAESLFPYVLAMRMEMDWELNQPPELETQKYSPSFLNGRIPSGSISEKNIANILLTLHGILGDTIFFSQQKCWPWERIGPVGTK